MIRAIIWLVGFTGMGQLIVAVGQLSSTSRHISDAHGLYTSCVSLCFMGS